MPSPKNTYMVGIHSVADYSPFGVELDGRTLSNTGYRYKFNGMEADDEIKGSGNSYTTEFRQYDSRVGRWLSLDPLKANYSEYSPFLPFNGNPLMFSDPTGLYSEKKAQRKAQRIAKRVQNKRGYKITAEVVYGGKKLGYGVLITSHTSSRGDSWSRARFGGNSKHSDQDFTVNPGEVMEFEYSTSSDDQPNGIYPTGLKILREDGSIDHYLFNGLLQYKTNYSTVGLVADLPIGGNGLVRKGKNLSRLRYSASSIKAIRSSKGLLKKAKLPTKGKIRFVPRKEDVASGAILRKQHGYVDRFGNIWTKGPSRTKGEAFEWDVQLSSKGKGMLGHLNKGKDHINVSLKGRVTHGK